MQTSDHVRAEIERTFKNDSYQKPRCPLAEKIQRQSPIFGNHANMDWIHEYYRYAKLLLKRGACFRANRKTVFKNRQKYRKSMHFRR